MMTVQNRWLRLVPVLLLAALLAGCAAGRAFGRGENAARAGDWDSAVTYFRQALQRDPDRAEYQIALERAMRSASQVHLDQARVLEARGDLEAALREYRRASEYDPPNRQISAKVLETERRIRDASEAAQPQSNFAQLRAQAARQAQQPALIGANEIVPGIRFTNSSTRDALNAIGAATGINITYESTYQDRPITLELDNVTLEQALNQILSTNQLFYKVVNERTIMVIPDTTANRQRYEEQVIRTFFIAHADATELAQMINTVVRVPNMAIQPQITANKTANTIVVRASSNVAAIIERLIEANDNPRAEIVIDVQILEVNRTRTRTLGIDLSDFALSAAFSPEQSAVGADGGLAGQPFNANTITRGISTADFYLAVPQAVVNFLETDSETELIAKPQLRGAEGQKITLELGDEIPVPATVFTPIAQGGANTNPLTSFNYRTIGINVEMTPRVTADGDIILDLSLESSTLGGNINIAGQSLPSFGTRRVVTRLRLRDGESNLLAGLLRETDRRDLRGVPGLLRLPVLNKLFGTSDDRIEQTDIVMLLTPRIVRTQELTMSDVSPIFIGTQSNIGLGGPPPLIAPTDPTATPADPAAPVPGVAPVPASLPDAPAPPAPTPPAGAGVPVVPPGSSQIPGTTTLPAGADPTPGTPTAAGGAQFVVTPPGTDFRVGGGPYTVAVSATNAARLSAVSLTVTFNPAALRVRTVQEGSLMRAGGVMATFTQQVDAATGRIDIAIVRTGDATGVAGTGLLAAILFDAVGGGPASLSLAGTASAPGGAPLPVEVLPVPAVTVR